MKKKLKLYKVILMDNKQSLINNNIKKFLFLIKLFHKTQKFMYKIIISLKIFQSLIFFIINNNN